MTSSDAAIQSNLRGINGRRMTRPAYTGVSCHETNESHYLKVWKKSSNGDGMESYDEREERGDGGWVDDDSRGDGGWVDDDREEEMRRWTNNGGRIKTLRRPLELGVSLGHWAEK
jgi:hypothetical protein